MKQKPVGAKIQSIRESKELTREEVAQRSGLSLEQIERIEAHEDLPALSSLIKIARAIGVRLGTFLDDCSDLGPVVCRKGEGQKSVSFSTGDASGRKEMNYTSLSKAKSDRHMEPFFISIHPCNASEMNPSSHEGEEFIMVMEGEVEVKYGSASYQLTAGDTIYYDSIVPHHVHAKGEESARILAVIYTPL